MNIYNFKLIDSSGLLIHQIKEYHGNTMKLLNLGFLLYHVGYFFNIFEKSR